MQPSSSQPNSKCVKNANHPSCAAYFQQITSRHHNFFTFQSFALPSANFYQKDEQVQHTNFALLTVVINILAPEFFF